MRRLIRLIAVCVLAGLPTMVVAAASEWSTAEGARMRIAALPPKADGSVEAVLEIDIKPGWKTYWREPGASGVAPQLDFSASQNLVLEKVGFPVPEAIGEGQAGFNGYEKPVSLLLGFRQPQPGEKSLLAGSVLVGVCDKICIPFTATYQIDLDPAEKVSADVFGAVKLAQTFLPEKPGKDFSVLSSVFDEAKSRVTLELALPEKISPEIFVLPPAGFVIDKPDNIITHAKNALIELPVLRSPKGESLKAREMTVLVKCGSRAMETTLVLP